MELDDNTYSQIESYLLGNLSGKSLQIFNERLEVDSEFAKEVRRHQAVLSLLDATEDYELLKSLEDYSKDENNKERKIFSIKRNKFLAIAASFLLLLSVPVLYAKFNYSNVSLAQKNFKPYKTPGQLMGRGSEGGTLTDYQKGILAYSEKEYSKAIQFFEKVPSIEKEIFVNAQLYKGNALFVKKEASQAIVPLKKVLELSTNPAIVNPTNYCLARAYLSTNQIEKAELLLNQLLESNDSYYQNEAKYLLESLSNKWRSIPWVK